MSPAMPDEAGWVRPDSEVGARMVMIQAEARRDYETAALAAITLSDIVYQRSPGTSESFERQALVYAALHQASIAVWIAENRRTSIP